MAAKNKRAAWHAALQKVAAEAATDFPDNPGKVAQIEGAIATARMAVDDLHDYPAYALPTNI